MTTPHLSTLLKPTPRNLDGLNTAWARMRELAYQARRVDEPDGCTRTRCAGAHNGFPGSEHLWALTCLLCGTDVEVYYSHMRGRGGTSPRPPSRHKGCRFAGKSNAAQRAARYSELGIPLPAWDAEAGSAAKEAAPGAGAAAESAEIATTTRTAAARERAEKQTAAPKPQPRPPHARKTPTARNGAPKPSPPEPSGLELLRELLSFD
ncbi:hypothetical protein [Streptomyces violascens]|uniref:Uncharacterized protein n=1 Tax=Streptomyces violascens TaxID=67381 RepID=A0ABQ3QVD4_9ACTN|nr:hypothetical protein [Streptomyces violascens]GGU26504.1 hypothetical protein GCM10010289_54780 [Streptomyces violascens]GHI41215.1 hypothetical protein Sviol_56230 [Streptomyces violascens]